MLMMCLILPSSVMQGNLPGNAGINVMISPRPFGAQSTRMKEMPAKVLQEHPCAVNRTACNHEGASINGSAPAAK